MMMVCMFQSLLHYHMSDTTMPLSQLFSRMQRLKEMHTIIEDYTVGDTTLEQVFIAFARQAEQWPRLRATNIGCERIYLQLDVQVP